MSIQETDDASNEGDRDLLVEAWEASVNHECESCGHVNHELSETERASRIWAREKRFSRTEWFLKIPMMGDLVESKVSRHLNLAVNLDSLSVRENSFVYDCWQEVALIMMVIGARKFVISYLQLSDLSNIGMLDYPFQSQNGHPEFVAINGEHIAGKINEIARLVRDGA